MATLLPKDLSISVKLEADDTITARFEALELAIAANRHDLGNLKQASEYHEGRIDDLEARLTVLAARVDVIDDHLTRAVDSVEGIANELKGRIEDLELRVER